MESNGQGLLAFIGAVFLLLFLPFTCFHNHGRNAEWRRVAEEVMWINGGVSHSVELLEKGEVGDALSELRSASKRLDKLDSRLQGDGGATYGD